MERGWGYPIPDGYGDGTINLNPSGIGYEYGDMLRSRDKGLGRQYPYPTRPIAMSTPQAQAQAQLASHRHLHHLHQAPAMRFFISFLAAA